MHCRVAGIGSHLLETRPDFGNKRLRVGRRLVTGKHDLPNRKAGGDHAGPLRRTPPERGRDVIKIGQARSRSGTVQAMNSGRMSPTGDRPPTRRFGFRTPDKSGSGA
jgi:hypothetical protein